MKNDKIVNAFNTIQPNNEIKNRALDKVMQKQHKKRSTFKAAVSFAAVICLIVFGSTLFMPQGDNIFVVKAYAMEVQENGSVELREVDIADARPEYWGGYIDGATNTMYVGLGLRCEGENIERVEFSTDDGFFAEQYIGNLSEISTSGVPALYVGPDNQMVMFGKDFDNAGSTITLNSETVDDYLLFWGAHYAGASDNPSFPEKLIFHAKVTFGNGKTTEKDITIDLSGTGVHLYRPSEEQKAQNQKTDEALTQLLNSIPLDKCEIVPDSVQALSYGDTYEYHYLGSAGYRPITEETMAAQLFDENGVFRIGSYLPSDGSDGYIAVIERNGGGVFTGLVYKVTGAVILEYIK